MTKLEQRKLSMLREQYPEILTADQALTAALSAEEIKRACGTGDPAWPKFAYEQQTLETMALLLEKENIFLSKNHLT